MTNALKLLVAGIAVIVLAAVQVFTGAWAQEGSENSPMPQAMTLDECYNLALKRSETIGILDEKIVEVQGQVLQAISIIVPKSSFLLKEFHQEATGSSGGGSVGSSLTRASIPERKFTLKQPLFLGFKFLSALGGTEALAKQRTLEAQRGRELLFMDVVEAFYGLLQPRYEVESLQNIRELSQQRIAELQGRVRLGKSRPSEIANAVSQLKTIQAQIEQTRRDEIAWVNVLRFLTGKNELGEIVDSPEVPQAEGELELYLTKAQNRSDVQAAQKGVIVAQQNIVYARADFFPKLTWDGNFYTKRVGFQSDIDWDMAMTFDVPLFEIVKVSGAVKEAKAKLREAELELSRVLRLAETEVRSAYTELKLSLAAHSAFHEAEVAAKENFDIQTKEYRLNLVNNLDVLAALQSLETVRRDLLKARYQAKRDLNRLKVAIGEVP